MKYCFGDIVIVNENEIGVIVKDWIGDYIVTHEVYVRNLRRIIEYKEEDIERYMVRHKELNEEEMQYQKNAIYDRS